MSQTVPVSAARIPDRDRLLHDLLEAGLAAKPVGEVEIHVACPDGKFKQNSCPGGEAGKAALGINFPGCQISFFDPNTCKVTKPLTREDLQKLESAGHFKKK